MTSAQRIHVQQAWTSNQIRVVCATIAYGMGIDKEDVRYVIHTVLPKSIGLLPGSRKSRIHFDRFDAGWTGWQAKSVQTLLSTCG